ncbi:MAG: Spermidine synthase, partial [uncultured Actinomycetospora sp.]
RAGGRPRGGPGAGRGRARGRRAAGARHAAALAPRRGDLAGPHRVAGHDGRAHRAGRLPVLRRRAPVHRGDPARLPRGPRRPPDAAGRRAALGAGRRLLRGRRVPAGARRRRHARRPRRHRRRVRAPVRRAPALRLHPRRARRGRGGRGPGADALRRRLAVPGRRRGPRRPLGRRDRRPARRAGRGHRPRPARPPLRRGVPAALRRRPHPRRGRVLAGRLSDAVAQRHPPADDAPLRRRVHHGAPVLLRRARVGLPHGARRPGRRPGGAGGLAPGPVPVPGLDRRRRPAPRRGAAVRAPCVVDRVL